MTISFDLHAISGKVYGLLTKIPETRDDDLLLTSIIWNSESNSNTKEDFLNDLTSKKLSHPESIRRVRQKLQEKHPSLRGDRWESRHQMEGMVCEQLTFF